MRYFLLFSLVCFVEMSFAQGENLIEVEALPFCSANYNEYNLVLSKKGGYLLSNHPYRGLKEIKDSRNGYLSSIYYQNNLKSRNISANKIAIRIKYHIGSFCLNQQMDYLIYTAQKSEKDLNLGLFYIQKEGFRWTKPKPLFEQYSGVNVMDPNLSITGDTLFFAANLQGGEGGTDIYMATGTLGNWTNVVSLGKNVNTPFNERFPNYFTQKLYFSSTGSGGNGGMDIYSVDNSPEGFVTAPYHFPFPINSDEDDFGYFPISNEMGYLSSNRNGQDDIFIVKTIIPEFECFEYEKISMCYEFIEEGETVTDYTMYELEWSISDGTKYKGEAIDHCFLDTGVYIIGLNLIDKATNEIYMNVATYEIEIENPDQLDFNAPIKIEKGKTIVIETPFIRSEEKMSYYWDFGDGTIGYGREVTHTYTKVGQYQINLGLIIINSNGEQIKKCTSKAITVTN